MRNWMLLLLFVITQACSSTEDSLIGHWAVDSPFYSATYQILEMDEGLSGLVLYYNDGTTQYRHDGGVAHYIFSGLQKEEDCYVDGISGATSKEAPISPIEIRSIHADTLEVTTHIMNRPLVEIWTRKLP